MSLAINSKVCKSWQSIPEMFSIVVERLNSKESLKIIHNIYRVTAQLLSINNDYLGGWEMVQPAFYVSCVHPRYQTPAGYINKLE